MSDHQIHMVSHGDIAKDRLKNYPVIYSAGLNATDMYPHEITGLKQYQRNGGKIVATPMPDYYHPEEVWQRYGVKKVTEPVLDGNGNPRKNKDGTPRVKNTLVGPFSAWKAMTKEHNWQGFNDIEVAELWTQKAFTHIDEEGKEAKWTGSHWTGHHNWAPYRGSSLHQYKKLAQNL